MPQTSPSNSRIADTGEDELIASLTRNLTTQPDILVGVGDDCAVLKKDASQHTLLKTDTVVEGVHFESSENPARVGWKAAARVVSDFASMGGEPEALLVTIILPPETELSWIKDVYKGIESVCEKFRCSVVGGETSSAPAGTAKIISISGTGTVLAENLTLRSGGSPSDLIYVTGRLGGSITGKHLDFTPRVEEAQWLAEHAKPSAMMDLSDGIAKDLPRLTQHSGCGFELEEDSLPLNPDCSAQQALQDGEDYELLFTIPSEHRHILESGWAEKFSTLELSHIGQLTEKSTNTEQQPLAGGWDHFQK